MGHPVDRIILPSTYVCNIWIAESEMNVLSVKNIIPWTMLQTESVISVSYISLHHTSLLGVHRESTSRPALLKPHVEC